MSSIFRDSLKRREGMFPSIPKILKEIYGEDLGRSLRGPSRRGFTTGARREGPSRESLRRQVDQLTKANVLLRTDMALLTGDFDVLTTRVNAQQNSIKGLLSEKLGATRERLEQESVFRLLEGQLRSEISGLQKEMVGLQAEIQPHVLEAAKIKAYVENAFHDAKTPLQSMELIVPALLESFGSTVSEDSKSLVSDLMVSYNQLKRLCGSVLGGDNVQEFSVQDVFRDLNGILAPIAKVKGLDFSCSCPVVWKDLLLKGDYLSVLRILVNLGSNALKFTDSGSVNILMEPVKLEGGKIVIKFSVKDTGSGISGDEKAKLFERFSRLEKHSSVEGTGIGLNSSFQKVAELGGELVVESEVGEGSIFSFTISVDILEHKVNSARAASPLCARDVSVVEATSEIIEIPSHIKAQLPILVVDDNKMNRKLLIHQLGRLGFKNIYQASNGLDAMKDALINNYFLIITDQNMGEGKLKGTDMALTIKKVKNNATVYLLTGTMLKEDVNTEGCDRVLMKPIRPKIMENYILEDTLRQYSANPEFYKEYDAVYEAVRRKPLAS